MTDDLTQLRAGLREGRFFTWQQALDWCDRSMNALDALQSERDEARARVTALKKGLEPFANIEIGPIEFRDGVVTIPTEWIDRARALLNPSKGSAG